VKACFTPQEIGEYFSKYGQVMSIKMKKSRKKKVMNRGFCLIKYQKVKSARRVIEIKNHTIMGRLVTCREYLKGEKLKEGKKCKNERKIYISGLSPNTVNEDIIQAFRRFGNVESGYTLKEQATGHSKGFGFVTFETKKSVKKALDSHHINIKGETVQIAPFSKSRDNESQL
jgi:RNA recognition motif-containing protein